MKPLTDTLLKEEPAQPTRKAPTRRSARVEKAETSQPSLEETLKAVVDKEVAARSTLKAKRVSRVKQLAIEPAYVNNIDNPTVVIEQLDNSILLRKIDDAVHEVVDLDQPQQAAEVAAREAEDEDRLLMDAVLFSSP